MFRDYVISFKIIGDRRMSIIFLVQPVISFKIMVLENFSLKLFLNIKVSLILSILILVYSFSFCFYI